MKQYLFIAIMLVLASCGSKENQKPSTKNLIVHTEADTTIAYHTPVTKDRYACGTGKKLKNPQLIGMNTDSFRISLKRDVRISADSLEKIGWFYVPSAGVVDNSGEAHISNPEFTWGWFSELAALLFWILLFIVLLYLLLWLITRFGFLFKDSYRAMKDCHNRHKEVSQLPAPPAPLAPDGNSFSSMVQMLQKTGGTVNFNIKIPDQGNPNEKK